MATPHFIASAKAKFFRSRHGHLHLHHTHHHQQQHQHHNYHHHHNYNKHHINVLLFILVILFRIMEPVEAFNYSENVLSCKELSCANNNVCYATIQNGTQQGHAYCQCQGEWAGLRCQSKLHVTRSSTSTTSISLRIRGMTSSKPFKVVPMSKLYVTDFSLSYWNLNESSGGCNILRLKTLHSRVRINGLDNAQEYMVCVANGDMDLCRLQSSNASKISIKSNCVLVSTKLNDEEPFDIIRLVIAPIIVVLLIAIIIAIFIVKRKSPFVQFILYFFCCRKCYCCRQRTLRKKQHITRKQRNTSGNFLLPHDPDQPFDDSMSFGARSFASNSALSGAGNRSSVISDSFRSGFTPDSDEKFPSFMEENNPKPLYNPNVLSSLEFQPVAELDNNFYQTTTDPNSKFLPIPPDHIIDNSSSHNFNTLPSRQNSLPSTFHASSSIDYNTLPYILNHSNQTTNNTTPYILSEHQNSTPYFVNAGDDNTMQIIHHHGHNNVNTSTTANQNESPSSTSNPHQSITTTSNNTSSQPNNNNSFLANHFPSNQSQSQPPPVPHQPIYRQNTPLTHHQFPNDTPPTHQQFHNNNTPPPTHQQHTNNTSPPAHQQQQTPIPNGKPQLFRRHFSTPTSTNSNEKSPPGSVRVFPHGDEWTRHLQRTYNYDTASSTPTHSTFASQQNTFNTLDMHRYNNTNSLRRKRRPIMKRRPLSYDFDYHRRYNLDNEYFSDNARNFLVQSSNTAQPTTTVSHSTYAVATLPRRQHSEPHHINTSPHRHRFTRSNSTTDSFYSPHELNTLLPHHLNQFPAHPLLPHDKLQNGDNNTLFSSSNSNSKEDALSMSSSYTESSISKDSNNSNEQPSRKKRVKNLIGQFERTLPPFFRQNSRRRNSSTTFCDEEYFRDLSSPFAVERKTRRNSNSKKKNRPLSQPVMFEFNGNGNYTSQNKTNGHDLDPIFQGHPSQHVIPPLTTQVEEECHADCNVTTDHNTDDLLTTNRNVCSTGNDVAQKSRENVSSSSSSTLRKGGGGGGSEDRYVISAFDDDATNLVTPFIVKKSSSDESVAERHDVTTTRLTTDSYCA